MRLTRAGEYAVRAVLYLSGKPFGSVVPRKEISRQMDIPMEFLGKIAKQLKRNKILEIVQGNRGGLRLLIKPEELSLLKVVETMTGELFLNDCVMRPDSCNRSGSCTVHQVWEKARNQLRETLEIVSFQELLLQKECVYDIKKDENVKP